jgi:hypothetical protein
MVGNFQSSRQKNADKSARFCHRYPSTTHKNQYHLVTLNQQTLKTLVTIQRNTHTHTQHCIHWDN